MSDQQTTTGETVTNGVASDAPSAAPSRVGRAPRAEDMPKRRRTPRTPKPRPSAAPVEAAPADVDELDVDDQDDDEEPVEAGRAQPFPVTSTGGSERRVPRVKYGATFHPHVWAELVVYCETHDYSIATVLEHAAVRFLMLRGVKVPGIWDDPELHALLSVGRGAAGSPG